MSKTATIKERVDLKPRKSNCGSRSLIFKYDGMYFIFPTRCKSWSCPRCAQINADFWAQKVSLQPCQRFLTLTNLGPDRKTVNTRVTELFRRIRKLGINFQYWGMVELHKSGLPHWHSICHGDYIPPLVLKWLARESDIGHTDIRQCKSGRGAAYYCTKHLCHAHGRRWEGRAVRYSRGFFVDKSTFEHEIFNRHHGEWEMVFGRAKFVSEKMQSLGYQAQLMKEEPDFLMGENIVDGEVNAWRPRTAEMGYGIFKWRSKGVTYREI